jgi:CheY-like chemotaxis protein
VQRPRNRRCGLWLSEWLRKRNTAVSESAAKRLRILAVSICLDDIFLLEYLGNQHGWELKFTGSPHEAFRLASNRIFDLILCNRSQPGYPWREVMDRLAANSPRSCILLLSPTNDDYLWWDVLHHRGFDILIHPLREEIVLRAVDTAIRCVRPMVFCSST